jgi:hypothetical protein
MLECRCYFVTRDDRRYRVQAPPKATLAVDAQQNKKPASGEAWNSCYLIRNYSNQPSKTVPVSSSHAAVPGPRSVGSILAPVLLRPLMNMAIRNSEGKRKS